MVCAPTNKVSKMRVLMSVNYVSNYVALIIFSSKIPRKNETEGCACRHEKISRHLERGPACELLVNRRRR